MKVSTFKKLLRKLPDDKEIVFDWGGDRLYDVYIEQSITHNIYESDWDARKKNLDVKLKTPRLETAETIKIILE